jgi:hypothetical protein
MEKTNERDSIGFQAQTKPVFANADAEVILCALDRLKVLQVCQRLGVLYGFDYIFDPQQQLSLTNGF